MVKARSISWLSLLVLACAREPGGVQDDAGESESSADEVGDSDSGSTGSSDASDAGTSMDGDADTEESDSSAETSAGLDPVCDFDLADSIDPEDLAAHLAALDTIGTDNAGTRVSGTPGYDASAEYVEARLVEAGYSPTRWEFEFDRYEHFESPLLGWTDALVWHEDFEIPTWSPAGSVTAEITPVDLDLALGNAATSGCEPEDFAGFPVGSIALVQRGNCTFVVKAANAEAAGASALLIFNQGHEDTPTAMGLFGGSLGSTNDLTIPVALLPYPLGEDLAAAAGMGGAEVSLTVDAGPIAEQTFNVFAERPGIGADAERVVMLGAHLDSVPAGPGINDNGSGSALVLTLAERFAACNPRYTVRFAWWGAEEWGLIGSRRWVEELDELELARIALYLNFDMVASPNYVLFVHSGENGPAGSLEIFDVFEAWFSANQLEVSPTGFAGNSDYQPFVDAGIASGGLATGAGGSKSQGQVDTWGGQVGEPYDSCYHQACDTQLNIAASAHEANARAAAWSLARWSSDLSPIDEAMASANVAGEQIDQGQIDVQAHDHVCGEATE